jgi:putative DNA primase/helicase
VATAHPTFSEGDVVASLLSAMAAAGIHAVQPLAGRVTSGKIVRFRCQGDRPGRENGWAVIHLDGRPAGAFGHYRLGISCRWRFGGEHVHLSPAQRAAQKLRLAQLRAAREAEQVEAWEQAAVRAERMFGAAAKAVPGHPYLVRKRISGEGMRGWGSLLLIPLRDLDGRIWNIQRIDAKGEKRFLAAARTAGLCWTAGEPGTTIVIGEGVATVAAIRRATGHAVFAALSASNLEPVARAVHGRFRSSDIIIAADDDRHLPRNVGRDSALAAAAAIGARIALPAQEGAR